MPTQDKPAPDQTSKEPVTAPESDPKSQTNTTEIPRGNRREEIPEIEPPVVPALDRQSLQDQISSLEKILISLKALLAVSTPEDEVPAEELPNWFLPILRSTLTEKDCLLLFDIRLIDANSVFLSTHGCVPMNNIQDPGSLAQAPETFQNIFYGQVWGPARTKFWDWLQSLNNTGFRLPQLGSGLQIHEQAQVPGFKPPLGGESPLVGPHR